MHSLPLFDEEAPAGMPDDASIVALLKRGLDYLHQGRNAVGASLCELARDRLTFERAEVAAIIDTFLASHAHYCQMRQALHEASRRFVSAEAEQQQLRTNLEEALTTLPGGANISSDQCIAPEHDPDSSLSPGLLTLYVTCFGSFAVRCQGQPIAPCPNQSAQTILRYLITQPDFRATMDALMALLWPDDEERIARHKVHVAVSALRNTLNQELRCLPGGSYILYKNGVYRLNPAVHFTSDVKQFLALYQLGQQSSGKEKMACYEQACQLYRGPFLVEDLYADWSAAKREQLYQCFVTMCQALTSHYLEAGCYEEAGRWARTLLQEDRCDEEAHRQLIQVYIAQGRRSDAIRQYQQCERLLAEELGVPPMSETMALMRGMQEWVR